MARDLRHPYIPSTTVLGDTLYALYNEDYPNWQCLGYIIPTAGASGFSLSSSPSSEDGQVTVCPGTAVTLTCTASQIEVLTWIQEPYQELRTFFAADYESEVMRVIDRDPYTLTLVAVDNVNGTIADCTSTLEVMVDDIEDGTTIACDVFDDEDQLTISKTSKAFEIICYKV